jgi:hypothetical protein
MDEDAISFEIIGGVLSIIGRVGGAGRMEISFKEFLFSSI